MQVAYSPAEIATFVGALRSSGTTTTTIRDIASLTTAHRPATCPFSATSNTSCRWRTATPPVLLLPDDYVGEPKAGPGFIYVRESVGGVGEALRADRTFTLAPDRTAAGIHRSAGRRPDGENRSVTAHIGPLCVVEDEVRNRWRRQHPARRRYFVGRECLQIGEGCWIMPGCVVASGLYAREERVRLQPGVVIGSDGFGYEFVQGRHEKIPQIGTVAIGDDVEIGANSTLDRARFSRTVVGEGTKIDNLVQIGHNVVIGKHCILCAQAGIAGSTTLEDYVILAGQAGIGGHITLGKGSKVGGQTGVSYTIAPGSYVNGTPAIPYMLERRLQILHQRLPDLFKRVEILEKKME